jgi:hypothetical protein
MTNAIDDFQKISQITFDRQPDRLNNSCNATGYY